MADNVTLNAGSGGDTFAADDISGVKYQRVKLVHGADGANDGDVASSNPLPITDTLGDAILATLREILARLPQPSTGDSMRVVVGESSTLAVSGTVTATVASTSIATIGNTTARPADTLVLDLMQVAADGLLPFVVIS